MRGVGRPFKIPRKSDRIIQINTFVKIGSINGFKSWLLTIRLVSKQMCSISFDPLKETPASTSRSPVFPRYLPILQFFKKIYSFQYLFARSCYCYQISPENIQRNNTIERAFRYFY